MAASPRQLPYAPTPYSYLPNPALTATINLDEVRVTSSETAQLSALIYSITGGQTLCNGG